MPALDSPGNTHKDAFTHAAQPAPSGKSTRYTSHGVCSSTREHWHIHYSSRTPRSLAYTQHPNRAFTHIAIAFTRHPTVAALTPHTHHNPTHTTQTHITYTRANPRASNGLRRRAIALRHSRRLCAATGTVPTVNTISRWQNLSHPPPAPR